MGVIKEMSPSLAALIAAGESVQHPASAVKELVENALDAGATAVSVELEGGGTKLIRCVDNGRGMDSGDAVLSLKSHATSKVYSEDDLRAIHTFGFRGEALSSILAVSHITVLTRHKDDEEGTRVEGAFGNVKGASVAMRTPGTTIEVRKLFHSTPAQLEYLSSVSAEVRRALRVMQAAAIGRPDVKFVFKSDGKTLLEVESVGEPRKRIGQVHGEGYAEKLLSFSSERSGVKVDGFVTSPDRSPARATKSVLYMNGRPFDDYVVGKIASDTFRDSVVGRKSPEVFLFVMMGAERFNPNVSPDKSKIKFRRTQGLFYASVTDGFKAALASFAGGSEKSEAHTGKQGAVGKGDKGGRGVDVAGQGLDIWGGSESQGGAGADGLSGQNRTQTVAGPVESDGLERGIFQQARTFMVIPRADGILYVDQHSVHERVNYERLKSGEGASDAQLLLIPQNLDFDTADERLVLEELIPLLKDAGFDIEPSGPDSYWITAVPSWLSDRDVGRAVRQAVESMAEEGKRSLGNSVEEVRDKLLQRVACHAAVKAGQVLSDSEMRVLWKSARSLDLGLLDVHGRPGAVFVSNVEIARRVGRGSLPSGVE